MLKLSINSLRVIEQNSLFSAEYSQAMRQELEDLEARLDAYNLLMTQKKKLPNELIIYELGKRRSVKVN